jgi:NAD+ dependent glucose-6-phosphate dehydrogenase
MLELGYRPQDSWQETVGEPEDVVPGGEHSPDAWPQA